MIEQDTNPLSPSKIKITDTFEKVKTISPDKVRKWFAKKGEREFTLIDVRQPEEYSEGHIPGALLIPLPELLDRISELDPTKPAITYCRVGNRSRAAASLLIGRGFKDAKTIEGGITAWNGFIAVGEYEAGMFLLKGRKTPEELVSLAWALEGGTKLFYEKAREIVMDKEANHLFNLLAEAEEKHKSVIFETYKQIKGGISTDKFLKEESSRGFMEGGVSLEETFEWLKSKERNLRDILELSIQVETNSLDLYIKIRNEIEDENSKKVFSVIIEEEKAHLSRLGTLLSRKLKTL